VKEMSGLGMNERGYFILAHDEQICLLMKWEINSQVYRQADVNILTSINKCINYFQRRSS
jgi:hypothetical protein